MKKASGSAPIRTEILSVNLLVTAVIILFALGSTLWLDLWQAHLSRDRNLLNSANIISRAPLVAETLADKNPTDVMDSDFRRFLDEAISQDNDVDLVVVADLDGVQYYYPDPVYIGQPYAGEPSVRARILTEPAFTANDTGLFGAERCAYAQVRTREGELVGFVMVGLYMSRVSQILTRTIFQFLLIAAASVLLGVLLSTKLSVKIKGSLKGYEPDAFLHIFNQREDILQALEEGILAIDRNETVIYCNHAAMEMLELAPSPVGRKLHEVAPASTLSGVVRDHKAQYNLSLQTEHMRILAAHIPLIEDQTLVGAVAIFRDRTEVAKLAEDLTGVNHIVEAMRAYTHEFMNKLHVILGLIQLGETEMAEKYIMDTTRIQQEGVSRIMYQIEDQSAAALLIGKTSHAAELGVQLLLDPKSRLGAQERFLPSSAYVTILGNLIENAINALNREMRANKRITVSICEKESGLLLCVEDNGPGLAAGMEESIFRRGYTTQKEGQHGTGLFLVKEVVDAYKGTIRVESEPEVGTAFYVTFQKMLTNERE